MLQSRLFFSGFSFLLALAAAAACTESFPKEMTSAPPPARFDKRASNTTCVAGALPLGRVRLEPTFKGFTNPIKMRDRPDRGLVYVAEMAGRIKVLDRATGNITTALDIVSKIAKAGDSLLGMAFHPSLAKPYVYVTVERDPDATTTPGFPNRGEVIRFTVTDDGKAFDPASEKLILRVDRPYGLHPPGNLEFGKDGFLYIGIGESLADPTKRLTDGLLGSIARIDVDGADPYAIPPDNPFANGGGAKEIWAAGFRNPWRFSFDRETGDLWEGDVGADLWESINKVERGKNYGWPTLEGSHCFIPKVGCDRSGFTPPVFTYPHSEGGSITGGYVYRGKGMPDLVGKYVYGDFTVGHVRLLEGSGANAKAVFLNPGGPKPGISSFAEDADGELYAIGWDDGIIYKLVPGEAQPQPAFSALLSQTGCVDPANPKQVAGGLVPYGVNVELWSDGAEKRRFIGIPDGTTIHVENDGDFTFPSGSILVKEFSVGGKRIETRLLRHHTGGEWTGATYEWNDAETDARLLDTAKEKTLPNGQTWVFPSPIQCFVCHKKVDGIALGLESLQLNRDFTYVAGQTTNQLTTLSDLGYLDKHLDAPSLPRLPELTSGAPLEDRARAYLHANCSNCHRPGGGTGAPMDFRYGLPRSAIKGCKPSGFPGVDKVQLLTPGAPERSAIFRRMSTRDYFPMPPLATRKVDDVAAAVLEGWIRSLETCD